MQQQQIDFIRDSLSDIASRNYKAKEFLAEVYILLSGFFPIDTMHLAVFDLASGKITGKAFVINKKVMLLNEEFELSHEAREIANILKDQKNLMFPNSNELFIIREITNQLSVKATVSFFSSSILRMEGDLYTALTFAAYGESRYDATHIELINHLSGHLEKIIPMLLLKIKKESRNSKAVSGILELRTSLEHQRIDLTLNSQYGLKNVVNQVEQVGPLESPVLITGETGVGKEIIAQWLHGVSNRSHQPFIAVNCGALPETLLDSELFGYEKGAFTGAAHKRAGYFEQADKGIIFLDEVGELSLPAQTKLLRVLQNKTFQRVGGSEPVTIDVRVVAATNRNIPEMIKKQAFREDLWYRLNVFPIEVPPLRNRKQDIPVLVQYLINSKLYEMNLPFKPKLGPEAMDQLMEYDWPGNIRELQNIIERALILSKGEPLSFPGLIPQKKGAALENTSYKDGRFLSMDQMVTRHIHQSLKLSQGKIGGPGGAAELLEMHPSTLRARMKKLNIKINKAVE